MKIEITTLQKGHGLIGLRTCFKPEFESKVIRMKLGTLANTDKKFKLGVST